MHCYFDYSEIIVVPSVTLASSQYNQFINMIQIIRHQLVKNSEFSHYRSQKKKKEERTKGLIIDMALVIIWFCWACKVVYYLSHLGAISAPTTI